MRETECNPQNQRVKSLRHPIAHGKLSRAMTLTTEVRGSRAVYRKAPLRLRLLSTLLDAAWVILLYWVAVRFLGVSPYPKLGVIAAFAGLCALAWSVQIATLGASLGQRTLGLQYLNSQLRPLRSPRNLLTALWFRVGKHRRSPALYTLTQKERLTSGASIFAWGLAVGLPGFAITQVVLLFQEHPLTRSVRSMEIPRFSVSESSNPTEWKTLPFYYALTPLPTRFEGDPVLFALPYQKGPPKDFLGKLIARWKIPDVRLVIEGPKTPERTATQEELRHCLLSGILECWALRESALKRHLEELREFGASHWELSWFEVSNPVLPTSERPQGIYFAGWDRSRNRVQERWILINKQGRHQALILERDLQASGELASTLLRQSIGGMQLLGDLSAPRAFVAGLIQNINLSSLEGEKDAWRLAIELAEVQSILLSQISVDPKEIEPFLHLAGTSLYLLKQSLRTRKNPPAGMSPVKLGLLEEWTAALKPLIQSCLRYAQDIDPKDANTLRIEQIWLEAQRL